MAEISPRYRRRKQSLGCAICNWSGEKAHRREECTAQVLSRGEEGGKLVHWWTTLSRKPRQGHTASLGRKGPAKRGFLHKAPTCLLSQQKDPPMRPVEHSRCPVPFVEGKIKDVPKRLKVPGAAAWKQREVAAGAGRSWGEGGSGSRAQDQMTRLFPYLAA